jgi:flavin-dependent dehydrogenase
MSQSDGIDVHADIAKEARVVRTRLLIGADGSSSTVSRALRGSAPPTTTASSRFVRITRATPVPPTAPTCNFSAESFPGYYWLFPTGAGRANVGVGMVLETLPPTSDHLREMLLGLVEKDAALHARLERGTIVGKVVGWPLTTYNAKLPIVGERVMLVGDAADSSIR